MNRLILLTAVFVGLVFTAHCVVPSTKYQSYLEGVVQGRSLQVLFASLLRSDFNNVTTSS